MLGFLYEHGYLHEWILLKLPGTDVFNMGLGADEFLIALLVISLLMVAFSREKTEDEMTRYERLNALMWSVIVSFGLMLLGTFFIYGLDYLGFVFYNSFTVLLVFITRFRWVMWRLNRPLPE